MRRHGRVMPVRWKLNIVVGLLVAVFVLTAGFAMRAVSEYMDYARTHAAVRELAGLTGTIHVGVYRHLLATEEESAAAGSGDRTDWLTYALRDTDRQVRTTEVESERELWQNLRNALEALASPTDQTTTDPRIAGIQPPEDALLTQTAVTACLATASSFARTWFAGRVLRSTATTEFHVPPTRAPSHLTRAIIFRTMLHVMTVRSATASKRATGHSGA